MSEHCAVYVGGGFNMRKCGRDAVEEGMCKRHLAGKRRREANREKWQREWADAREVADLFEGASIGLGGSVALPLHVARALADLVEAAQGECCDRLTCTHLHDALSSLKRREGAQ